MHVAIPSHVSFASVDVKQVLMERLEDRNCSIVLRNQILRTIIALLHQPEAMDRFVQVPSRVASTEECKEEDATGNGEGRSGYQRLLEWMLEPVMPMLLPSLQHIFRLAAAWDSVKRLCEASETLLTVTSLPPAESDAVCTPILRILTDVVQALHTIAASVPASDQHRLDLQRTARIRRPSSWSQMAGLGDAPASQCPPELQLSQAKLLSGAGIWHAMLAIISAPALRSSR